MISEEILWEYTDGTLDETQRKAVAQAIADDSAIAARYKEITATHQHLQIQATESPSAAFTANVMSAINGVPVFAVSRKISVLPVIAFALPLLAIALAACVVLSNQGIIHPFNFQISPAVWSNLRFYSILADAVLMLLFVETWYHRFKSPLV